MHLKQDGKELEAKKAQYDAAHPESPAEMPFIQFMLDWLAMKETTVDITTKVPDTKIEDTAITFIPADKEDITAQLLETTTTTAVTEPLKVTSTTSSRQESYTVQKGDTLESIIIRFYGSYKKSHENAIKEANKMSNPNALQIGQKLIIPLH